MADTSTRPSGRGRGSFRGGRGGYRGGRGAIKTAKFEEENVPFEESSEDQGEIGELKKKYSSKVPIIKEMFPDWTTEDIVFALEETNGDEAAAIERIAEGNASQWGEVKKKTDRSRSKVKEAIGATETSGTTSRGRGRGGVESRGRGRGDRGERGRARGGRAGAQLNGTRAVSTAEKTAKIPADGGAEVSAPVETPSTWDTSNGDTAAAPEPAKEEAPVETPKAAAPKPTGWASLFAKPPPVKAAPKPAAAPAAPIVEPTPETIDAPTEETPQSSTTEQAPIEDATQSVVEPPTDSDVTLTPSKDELNEINLEKLPDVSHPPETATAASTVASTMDPHSTLTSAVSHVGRPQMSGYATSALKATAAMPRSASFQRKVLEQQEAVVMPGDRAVDRAAVQFGSMGLNGSEDAEEEDREEPETRAQPPTDSPVAPRASLPPAPISQQPQSTQQQMSEPLSAARPAPGLPPAPQHQQSPTQASAYADYSRYGQPAQTPKAYDPFGQQAMPAHSQPQESFAGAQSQALPPTTSAPGDYSSFYGANQQRDAYTNNYYGNYMQGQDAQQRSGSAFGGSAQEAPSQYKYGQQEAQSSGHNTPNPTTQAQQQQQSQQHVPQGQNAPGYPYAGYPAGYGGYPGYNQYQMHQQQQQQAHQYGRNRPMFDDARRYEQEQQQQQQNSANYMGHNNYYGGHYGGGSYGKPNMYGHQYSYDHSASPAATSGFGGPSAASRDSGYRTGSTQPSEAQQSSAAFGGMDPFGRSQSGFGGQQQSLGQQGSGEDASKPGPSPSLAQVGRSESAANSGSNAQAGGQSSGFPPPQSQQGGFGGYPQYGLGGFGGHQGGQNQQSYNSYGGGQQGFGANYGYGRNQWGQYGH